MQTVLITIGTSLFTTLIVEFFAKPYAEARKDRILERFRTQRRIGQSCSKILALASTIANQPLARPDSDLRSALDEDALLRRAQILESIQVLEEGMLANGIYLSTDELRCLALYNGYVKGAARATPMSANVANSIVGASAPIVDYLLARRVGRIGRRRHLKHALAVLQAE